MKANRTCRLLASTLVVCVLALTSYGPAQLAGNYTINPAVATGGIATTQGVGIRL